MPGVGRREKRLQRGLCAREGQAGDWFTYFMKRIFMFRGGLCLMGDATREQIQSHKIRRAVATRTLTCFAEPISCVCPWRPQQPAQKGQGRFVQFVLS